MESGCHDLRSVASHDAGVQTQSGDTCGPKLRTQNASWHPSLRIRTSPEQCPHNTRPPETVLSALDLEPAAILTLQPANASSARRRRVVYKQGRVPDDTQPESVLICRVEGGSARPDLRDARAPPAWVLVRADLTQVAAGTGR